MHGGGITSNRSGGVGVDVSQQLMFFTDDEPPQDNLGSRRHYFGRPSLRGYKQNPFRNSANGGPLKEEVILQNPEAYSVLRSIYHQNQHTLEHLN